MTVVVDASVAAEAFVGGDVVDWASAVLVNSALVVPPHFTLEVASVLRRLARSGLVSEDAATLAHADVVRLRTQEVPYAVVADRAWELRANLTPYDAAYVALAEVIEAPLATLDQRIVAAPGPRCGFLTP